MLHSIAFFKTGHRGCRGLYPENTLQGFVEALAYPINAIELDIVISRDNQVVVSHEAFMNPAICLTPQGKELHIEEERKYNLYTMTYAEIKTFDCGLKMHPRFPQQKKYAAYKPLLSQVIEELEKVYASTKRTPVILDIEIKSEPELYGLAQPEPKAFCQVVLDLLLKYPFLKNRVILRSFDPEIVKQLHALKSPFPLALIVENNLPAQINCENLGFTPFMYSPDHGLINEGDLKYLKDKDIQVVPWTVNAIETMNQLIHQGVNGIITDYPDLFVML